MKPLMDEIRSRLDALNTILEEHGGSEVFDGSRPQALLMQERQVLTASLEKLETIYRRWGNQNYTRR